MHKLLEAEDATATETRMITVHSGDKVMPLRAAYTSRRRDCSQNHVAPHRPAVEAAATGSYRHFEQQWQRRLGCLPRTRCCSTSSFRSWTRARLCASSTSRRARPSCSGPAASTSGTRYASPPPPRVAAPSVTSSSALDPSQVPRKDSKVPGGTWVLLGGSTRNEFPSVRCDPHHACAPSTSLAFAATLAESRPMCPPELSFFVVPQAGKPT
jgi:hypothetical protein